MSSNDSQILYGKLVEKLRNTYNPSYVKGTWINWDHPVFRHESFKFPFFITDGVFGAHMCVHIENDGPVTLELESNFVDSKWKENNERK